MPEIIINSPGASFVIQFNRTAEYCWIVKWPHFTGTKPTEYRALEYAMSAIAQFISQTEF